MKLLIAGDKSYLLTPEEIQGLVEQLLENHPTLPEFVTELVGAFNIPCTPAARIYARRYRLKEWFDNGSPTERADALIYIGEKDIHGYVQEMAELNKPWMLVAAPILPVLGVMTHLAANGERVELMTSEDIDKLEAEINSIKRA